MACRGERIAARARTLVGARFRPRGRCRAEGFDCVGAVAHAAGLMPVEIACDYALRGTSLSTLESAFDRLGLEAVAEEDAQPGDLLVFMPGPKQLHMGIHTGSTLVHADANAGRVVDRPLPAPWPLIGVWRFSEAG